MEEKIYAANKLNIEMTVYSEEEARERLTALESLSSKWDLSVDLKIMSRVDLKELIKILEMQTDRYQLD